MIHSKVVLMNLLWCAQVMTEYGFDCHTYFCESCEYAGYCDEFCGYCGDKPRAKPPPRPPQCANPPATRSLLVLRKPMSVPFLT